VVGMVVGAIIVGVLNNGMNLLSISSFWQTVALGVVLVLAVALDSSIRQRRMRSKRKLEEAAE
jgi:ribose transport system permease protein